MIDAPLLDNMRNWRQDFHAHPELAYKENRTAKIVADKLKSWGYDVHTGIAKTGIVAAKRFGDGPSIAIRADMDALPIVEATGAKYSSCNNGVMHACGHDGHTAMLMGAAEMLAAREDLVGTLYLVFQPAEENEGGAKAMVEAGIFDRFQIDAIYGLHNMPGMAVGTFQVGAGAVTAAFDTFDITVTGKGGHGALPEQAKDPIVAAAALVSAVHTIVSRGVRALDAVVVTIGQIVGGETYNVIPDQVTLKGSCRSLSPETQNIIETRITEICVGIGAAYNVEVECKYEQRYPAVINSAAETQILIKALETMTSRDAIVTDFEAVMGSEDFAFFLAEKPGCYFLVGNGFDAGNLHSPTYDFNDNALIFGAKAWVALAETALKR